MSGVLAVKVPCAGVVWVSKTISQRGFCVCQVTLIAVHLLPVNWCEPSNIPAVVCWLPMTFWACASAGSRQSKMVMMSFFMWSDTRWSPAIGQLSRAGQAAPAGTARCSRFPPDRPNWLRRRPQAELAVAPAERDPSVGEDRPTPVRAVRDWCRQIDLDGVSGERGKDEVPDSDEVSAAEGRDAVIHQD